MTKIIKNGIVYGTAPSGLSELTDTNISNPIVRNILAYDSTSSKWINSINNIYVGEVAQGGAIRDILVDTSISKGVYVYQTRYASDNPVSGNALTMTVIYKHADGGTYSRIYATSGPNMYYADTGSTVPTTLSWYPMTASKNDITSDVTFTETISGTNTHIYYKAGVLYIFYQGESKTHAAADVLFTLPSGYRPPNQLYVPFIINNSGYGNIVMNTNGTVQVNNLYGGSTAGRVYFSAAIPLS